MMLTASSMAPLCLLGQDDKKWCDMTYGHVTPVVSVLVSYDSVGTSIGNTHGAIINCTIMFIRIKMRCNLKDHQQYYWNHMTQIPALVLALAPMAM